MWCPGFYYYSHFGKANSFLYSAQCFLFFKEDLWHHVWAWDGNGMWFDFVFTEMKRRNEWIFFRVILKLSMTGMSNLAFTSSFYLLFIDHYHLNPGPIATNVTCVYILNIIVNLFAIIVQNKIQDNIPRDGQGTTQANTYYMYDPQICCPHIFTITKESNSIVILTNTTIPNLFCLR